MSLLKPKEVKSVLASKQIMVIVDECPDHDPDKTDLQIKTDSHSSWPGFLKSRASRLLTLVVVSAFLAFVFFAVLTMFLFRSAERDIHHDADDESRQIAEGIISTRYRLPPNVVPQTYNVRLFPKIREMADSHSSSLSGHVDISLSAQNDTDVITLHVADISVDPASVKV